MRCELGQQQKGCGTELARLPSKVPRRMAEFVSSPEIDMSCLSFARLTAVAVVCLLAWNGSNAANPTELPDKGGEHASTAAYPQSAVSLKDTETGVLFYVESNGRRLVAFDKDGTVMWSVDVFESGRFTPATGAAVVRNLKVRDKVLWVICGKHTWAKVDPKTGKVEFAGAE